MKSLKLAKEAKEEADDALDDVETAGSAGGPKCKVNKCDECPSFFPVHIPHSTHSPCPSQVLPAFQEAGELRLLRLQALHSNFVPVPGYSRVVTASASSPTRSEAGFFF